MSAIKKISRLQAQWETDDPFLFCAFHNDDYPEGNEEHGPTGSLSGRLLGQDFRQKDGWAMYHGKKVPGFPAHPHVGFETVTIAQKGFVDHADSLGAAGRFGNGDVQWMTAGKGVQHSEMFPLLQKDERNPLLLFQIWLNLPAKSKNVNPYFGMLWHEKIPKEINTDDNGKKTTVTVIAGTFKNSNALPPPPDSWAAISENDVNIWLIEMEPHANFVLPKADKSSNRSLYFYKGDEIKTEGFEIPAMHRIITHSDAELEIINGKLNASFLLLQGKPINEHVVQHGPFVANSRHEIEEALNRYRTDEFGGWPWPKPDQVHINAEGRFAKYPNGRTEKPS